MNPAPSAFKIQPLTLPILELALPTLITLFLPLVLAISRPHERQHGAAHHRQRHHNPPGNLHLPIPEFPAGIPRQMPDAVPSMKRKRPRNPKLQDALAHGAEAAEPLRHGGRLEVPAQQWRNQVRGAEYVDAAREDAAGDAVEGGSVPGDLGLVDGEVGGDGPVAALGDEDGVLVCGLRRLCLRGGVRGGGLEGYMSRLLRDVLAASFFGRER